MKDAVGMPSRVWRAFSLLAIVALLAPLALVSSAPASADDELEEPIEIGYVESANADVAEQVYLGRVTMQDRGDGITRFEYLHERQPDGVVQCAHPTLGGQIQHGTTRVTWGLPLDTFVDHGGTREFGELNAGWGGVSFWFETRRAAELHHASWSWQWDLDPGVRLAPGDRQWIDVQLPEDFDLSAAFDDPHFAGAWGRWGYRPAPPPEGDPACPWRETHGEFTRFVSGGSLGGSWLPREQALGRAVPAGDTVPVRLRLDNETGGPLTEVSVDEVEVVSLDEEGEAILVRDTSPEALRPSSVLGTGAESVTFDDYLLTGVEPGQVELVAELSGLDGDGQPVAGTVRNQFEVRPDSLKIEVEVRYPEPADGVDPSDVGPPEFQKDNNGDGVIDEADHRIEVVVTATNQTDETLTGVGPVADDDRVVRFSNRLVGDGQVSLVPIEEPHDLEFGDLEPEVPVERIYVYEAIGQVDAEVRALLEGVPESGGVVRGVGVGEVKLRSDLAVEIEIAMEQRPYTSGDTVRLFGTARNLLIDGPDESGEGIEEAPDVAVVISPIVEGNAGNGHILPPGTDGRTPLAEVPFVLASEEEVAVSAILPTIRTDEPSEASVRYLVRAWELGDDGQPAVAIDQSRIVISERDGFSAEHTTPLAPADLTPFDERECVTEVLDDIVTCNLYVGVRNFALGLWDLAQLVPAGLIEAGNATHHTLAWGAQNTMKAFEAVSGDEAAKQALITEMEVQLATFRELGIMAEQGAVSVADAVVQTLQEAEQVIESGDGEAVLAFLSRQAGENIDMTLGGLTKIRVLAAVQRSNADAAAQGAAARAAREARERAAREAQDGVEERVRDSVNRGEDPATNGTFRGNEDVTDLPAVTRGVYGTDAATLRDVRGVAQAENVLIGWRGRSAAVARLVDQALAYVKPMDVKAKTVNVIDVNYLGYRRSSLGTVELTVPPVDYRLTGQALEDALDAHMASLRTQYAEIAADPLWEAEVRKRLKMRTQEFPKQIQEFARYRHEGIKLEFGYDQQGLTGRNANEVAEIRRAQVNTVRDVGEDGVERLYFELEMEGRGGSGEFRPIAGDTDMVVIQNPDGTPILDQAKRRRIYEQLQELVGMQHGETMSYINAEVQAKLLRDHVEGAPGAEALLLAGPDGRVRTGYLRETFSTKLDADGQPASSMFHLASGAPGQLRTAEQIGQAHRFASYIERLDAYISTLTFYLPGRLADLVDALDDDQVLPSYDLDGVLIQPDGQGGVVIYLPGEAPDDAPVDPDTVERGSLTLTTTDGPVDLDDLELNEVLDALLDDAETAGLTTPRADGIGASGGRWVPADLDTLLTAGDGTLALAPMTTLAGDVEAGDTYLTIHDPEDMGMTDGGDWFAPGDHIVIDPGGPNEEFATVDDLGSLILTQPLTNTHETGTAVLRIAGSTDDGSGDDGGSGGDEEADGDGGSDDGDATGGGESESGGQDDATLGDGSEDDRHGRAGSNVSDSGDTRAGSDAAGRTNLARTGVDTTALLTLAAIMLTIGMALTRRRREQPRA